MPPFRNLAGLLLAVAAISTFYSFSLYWGSIAVTLGVVALLAWALWMLGRALCRAWRGDWNAAAMAMAMPLLALVLAYPVFRFSGDYIHLAVKYPEYEPMITKSFEGRRENNTPADTGVFIVFDQEEALFGNFYRRRNIIYLWNADTRKISEMERPAHVQIRMKPLIANFYVVDAFARIEPER